MSKSCFIKFNCILNKITGSQGATILMEALEFRFLKFPKKFWKFSEPCPYHRLYKKGDSFSEELGVSRKKLNRDFEKIGVSYNSRSEFEAATDIFKGMLYARYYDRNSNLTYYFRNHELVDSILHAHGLKKNITSSSSPANKKSCSRADDRPIGTGHSVPSYIEAKNTSNELSKDNSHAEDIIKKMIEIWTALVEEGRELVKFSKSTVPFLKKAFTDKFDNCLEKWKKYCYDIASSRFLMGEIKSSFRATLDWALKFDVIQKIFDGNYGIGDRIPKAVLPSQTDLQEEILSSDESQEIKNFRILCLKTVGNANYISNFKKLGIEFRDGGEIALIALHKFGADFLEQNCYSYLRLILEGLEGHITKIIILAPGEARGRLIERKKDGRAPTETSIEHPSDEEFLMEESIPIDQNLPEVFVKNVLEEGTQNLKQDADFLANLDGYEEEGIAFKDIPLLEVSLETKELRAQLRKTILPRQFPTWLGGIEVKEVCRDGTVVVALEDAFAVEWCRSRFSKEVFEAAASLWKGVNKLIIRQKEGDLTSPPIENLPKRLGNVAEKSILEQAIQSLRSVCSPKLIRTFGMQGTCGAFK